LEQAVQGSGGVPIPGGVQKPCRYGTSGHGLAGMGVLGWRLDAMIFSSLTDSTILSLKADYGIRLLAFGNYWATSFRFNEATWLKTNKASGL